MAQTDETIVLSVHGAPGVLDMVVPAGATPLDVAREYASQTRGLTGARDAVPALGTPVGAGLHPDRPLVEQGVAPGDVLVAVHDQPTPQEWDPASHGTDGPDCSSPANGQHVIATFLASLAVGCAVLAAWFAARAGEDAIRTVAVGLLLTCALVAVLPGGRHHRQRAAAAPAFGAAAALAALHMPDPHALPAVLAACGASAAVVASIGRALAPEPDEATTVWIVSGLLVLGACGVSPLFEVDPRVSWTLLLLGSMLATRFVPAVAVNVPDEALLDLDRLAVTAWSARDTRRGDRRGRVVVPTEVIARIVRSAARTLGASSVAILVITAASSALLLRDAVIDLDRIGARLLVLLAGGTILLAARSYRHASARAVLRAAGLSAWLALVVHLVATTGTAYLGWVLAGSLLLGLVAVAAAVATGRGWRSVWWARRAEVAEALCGSAAVAAAVVAAGIFRRLWETTS